MIRQAVATSLRQLGDDQVEVILSTRALARDGHILEPQGCLLDDYKKNPIVLFSHDPKLPVGTASAITVNTDKIVAKITFAPVGVSAIADEVRGLVKSGVIRSLSVGFDQLDGTPIDPQRPRGGQHITRWLLLEASFVAIPADTGSVVTARAHRSNNDMKQIIRASEAISEAQRHHFDLRRALEKEQLGRAMEAHRHIGRCLDIAERCLRGLGDGTELAAQTSNGMSSGTSGGRSFAARQADVIRLFPSAAERAARVAESMPRAPVWNGGGSRSLANWVAAKRSFLEADTLHRSAQITIGHRYSRAERQAELARLTRRD